MTSPVTAVACPKCQYRENSADANFCSRCGGALRGPPCPACTAPSEAGDRFCTQCGVALGKLRAGAGGRAGGRLPGAAWIPWAVAGILALTVIIVLVVDRGGRDITLSPPPAASSGGLGPTSAVNLDTMTPRDAATRLFRRVMTAVEAGNQTEANNFLPMAIAAYDLIAVPTLDDRFHLSLLHAAASDGTSALAVAQAGLAVRPTHLLCLAAAAQGALLLGDSATARAHYQTFVDVYDDESRVGLEEYGMGESGHGNLLPLLRDEALAYLSLSP